MDDRQVIENFLRAGSDETFSSVFEVFYPRLRRYFLTRGLAVEEAEELAQDVMVTVFRRIGEVREIGLFSGWLFKVAKNEFARYWRRQQSRNRLASFEPLDETLEPRLGTDVQLMTFSPLIDWLQTLDPAERELVLLRYVEELSYEELSVALDLPMGTVKWRLFNIKKKLAPIIVASSLGREARQIN